MRRLFVLVVIGVAGCQPDAPPEIVFDPTATATAGATYPAREDWLVIQAPAVVPPSWNTIGYPPVRSLMLGREQSPDEVQINALSGEVNKNILDLDDSNYLPKSDRTGVAKAVAALFGTPLAPAVPEGDSADAIAALGLDSATLARGSAVYRRWCVSCHGPAGGGDGPAAFTLNPPPRDYRSGIFKFSTASPTVAPGKARRSDLKQTIRRGLDGTAMPAFPNLSDADLDAVVAYVIHLSIRGEAEFTALKRLIVAFEDADPPAMEVEAAADKAIQSWHTADTTSMTPESSPVPPNPATTPEERLASAARGHTLFVEKTGAGCASCHVDYGRARQLKYDSWGNVIQPRNLPLGLYRGGRSPEDIYARIYAGIAGAAMPSHRQLVETPSEDGTDKIWDLVHFVIAAGDPALRAELRSRYGVRWE